MTLDFLHAFFSWLDPRRLVKKGPKPVCRHALFPSLTPLELGDVCILGCCLIIQMSQQRDEIYWCPAVDGPWVSKAGPSPEEFQRMNSSSRRTLGTGGLTLGSSRKELGTSWPKHQSSSGREEGRKRRAKDDCTLISEITDQEGRRPDFLEITPASG